MLFLVTLCLHITYDIDFPAALPRRMPSKIEGKANPKHTTIPTPNPTGLSWSYNVMHSLMSIKWIVQSSAEGSDSAAYQTR